MWKFEYFLVEGGTLQEGNFDGIGSGDDRLCLVFEDDLEFMNFIGFMFAST